MADEKLFNKKMPVLPVTITSIAVPANYALVQDQIREYLAPIPCNMRTLLELDMIVEEVFINIASYAYGDRTGHALIDLSFENDGGYLTMRFRDKGKPYNPLKKESPDISSPAENRTIGGLGIFLVQKYSDSLSYEYVDGENRLTIRKKIL